MTTSQKVVKKIPLDQLVAPPQVREHFDKEGLETLAATMRVLGQLQPIHVRKSGDKFIIEEGGRRFLAAPLAGLAALDAIVSEEPADEIQLVQKQVVANGQRQDLTPIELAKAIHRVKEARRCSASEVAAEIGVSKPMATRLLAMLSLTEEHQHLVATGKISLSAAYELTRIDDPAKRDELAKQVSEGGLTRDGLVGVVKASRQRAAGESEGRSGRATAPLSDGRVVTVSGQSLDLERFIEAMEEVLTKARRARTQGVELNTFTKMLRDQSR